MKKNRAFRLIFVMLFFCLEAIAGTFPPHWWQPVSQKGAPSWEILPQAARPGEVILSKRNELGLLSNFANTPFEFEGETYGSLEGFWQMMKFPEDSKDPRFEKMKHLSLTRKSVKKMVGFAAKRAGDKAQKVMNEMGIHWVTYNGRRMDYKGKDQKVHLDLVRRATLAKVEQNPRVQSVLRQTRGLVLRPDHQQKRGVPPAWRYFEIYMELRESLFQ